MSIHLKTENNTIIVEVRLFGAFRQYLSNLSDMQKSNSEIKKNFPNSITLTVQQNISIKDLRLELIAQLNILRPDLENHSLVFDSAFADEESILEDHQFVDGRSVLSILPPVCGG